MNIVLQHACSTNNIPSNDFFETCIQAAIQKTDATITARIVDSAESRELNKQFRGKDKATNVLSFPDEPIPGEDEHELGALVFCADVINSEIKDQDADFKAYWAHMTVHGCLHLLGFVHDNDADAEQMEAIEISILAKLGYNNPYA